MYRFICICIFVKYDITPSLKRRRGSRQEEVTCNNDCLPGLDGRISALIKVELEKMEFMPSCHPLLNQEKKKKRVYSELKILCLQHTNDQEMCLTDLCKIWI